MSLIVLGLILFLAIVLGGVGLIWVGPLALIVSVAIIIGALVLMSRAGDDLADVAAEEELEARARARQAGDTPA